MNAIFVLARQQLSFHAHVFSCSSGLYVTFKMALNLAQKVRGQTRMEKDRSSGG
jgi:hypothetical protein